MLIFNNCYYSIFTFHCKILFRRMKFTRISFIIFLVCFYEFSSAQTDSSNIIQIPVDSIKADDTSSLFIASISIYGNNKTKNFIIEREIPFKQGDYVAAKDI